MLPTVLFNLCPPGGASVSDGVNTTEGAVHMEGEEALEDWFIETLKT